MRRLLVAALVMVSVPLGASADIWCSKTQHPGDIQLWIVKANSFETGNALYEECQATGMELAKCAGYVIGIADVLQYQTANTMCMPEHVVIGQVVDVVKKFLRDHPETRHYSAMSQVLVALQTAFPCQSSELTH